MFPFLILIGLGYFVVRSVNEAPNTANDKPISPPPALPPKTETKAPAIPQDVVVALEKETDPAKLEALAKAYDATNPLASWMLRQRADLLKSQKNVGLLNPKNAAGVPMLLEQAMLYEQNPVKLEELAKMYDAVDPKAAATLRQKILAQQGGFPGLLNEGMLPKDTPLEVLTTLTYETNPDVVEAMATKYAKAGRQDLADALFIQAALLRAPWSGGDKKSLTESDPGYIEEALPWPGFPDAPPPGTEQQQPSVQGYGYGPYNAGVAGVAGERPLWLPSNMAWPPVAFNPSYPWV